MKSMDAEACALKQYPNTVDVIIGSDDRIIQRNSLGIIICRLCRGWIIVKDDLGKLAIPARWEDDNHGGDTYVICICTPTAAIRDFI